VRKKLLQVNAGSKKSGFADKKAGLIEKS